MVSLCHFGRFSRVWTPRIVAVSLAIACTNGTTLAATAGPHLRPAVRRNAAALPTLDRFALKDGRDVEILPGDIAVIQNPKTHSRTIRYLPQLGMATHGLFAPDRSQEIAAIETPSVPSHPYTDGELIVVLRQGTTLPARLELTPKQRNAMRRTASAKRRAPLVTYAYTNDEALNRALSVVGVSSTERLFRSIGSSRLATMRERARDAQSLLPVENAYKLTIENGTVSAAVARLRSVSSVLYAAPDFHVMPMDTPPLPLTKALLRRAQDIARSGDAPRSVRLNGANAFAAAPSGIPTNYAVAYSAQSALNAPGVNAIGAYDEIEKHFHELPGAGERITNVSLGDIVDQNTAANPNSPCYPYDGGRPTTVLLSGQQYLDLPAMPLIPAYVADDSGNLSGSGISCGQDNTLSEIGLDFSVMAALPHDEQRAGEIGTGYSDLLGIAPGAQYRLVVPATTATSPQAIAQGPTASDIAGALLGAAEQRPAPNVITMSVGFGLDQYGFPSRYLEEDPLMHAIVSSIVAQGIVVCISAGDGLRLYTNAPVGPSGGTAPLDVVTSRPSNIVDDQFSTTPSRVVDSGAIAVGGTTLDDVNAAPPYQPQFEKYRDQLTFPEVRWNGMGSFASTFGSRVNISAPSDNILAENLTGVGISGGTSASAPMVAAGAAIALQVARLTGKPFDNPESVRSFLVSTARDVPNVPQADVKIDVGPQLDVENEVETLLHRANVPMKPALARVAIAQRYPYNGDFEFTTDVDPSAIDLTDAYSYAAAQNGSAAFEPITIAPDWEALPPNTKFRLFVSGSPNEVLGTGPWARLYPQALLAAVGESLYSTQPRTVSLTYRAYVGFHTIAQATVGLTFSPNGKILQGVGEAPAVPPVVTTATIPVKYDISQVAPSALYDPQLIVSYPGRMATWTAGDPTYKPVYTVPITQRKGTIQVPVSALKGDGIYGFAIQINTWARLAPGWTIGLTNGDDVPVATMYSFARVATSGAKRPPAPVLTYEGDAVFPPESGHIVDATYGYPFQVTWNVGDVPGATGALLEISFGGPSLYGNYDMFNNPNGSVVDDDGADNGSVYTLPLPGVRGTKTVTPWALLVGTNDYTVRVFATSGGKILGEGGDVSTLATHGIVPADGGQVIGGFDANPRGSDGILTSNQLDAMGDVDSSMETFDQTSETVTTNLSELSTYAGITSPSSLGLPVSGYVLNGFGMNYLADTAMVPVETAPWGELGGFLPGYAQYLRNLDSSKYQYADCDNCLKTDPPANTLWLAYTGDNNGPYDYALTWANNTVNVQPVTTNAFGTPVPVPDPVPGSIGSCVGFAVDTGVAAVAFWNGPITLQILNSLYSPSGSPASPVTVSGINNTTCNVVDLNADYWGLVGYESSPGSGTSLSQLAQVFLGNTTLIPLSGYEPVGFTRIGNVETATYWAVTNALEADYLTNDNAVGSLDVLNGTAGSAFHGYYPFGHYNNVVIPTNSRYAAGGQNFTLYLLGVDGNEIAPLATGL